MDPDSVAKAFVEHYYTTFDANRTGLANLYQEGSMLTFEGQKIQGSQNIVAKLTSLPFQQCQHSITTVDCQPSGPAGGMLVFVSGNLQLAGEQHALKFSQVFTYYSYFILFWFDFFCDLSMPLILIDLIDILWCCYFLVKPIAFNWYIC